MMSRMLHLLIALLIITPGMVAASDVAKEQRWAEQIVDALLDGEAEWLEAGGHEFLSIYTESSEGEVKRAAIVLHGIGAHPDWPQVVFPLRVGLAERGWATLSLQMPVLPNEAETDEYKPLFNEVAPRIDAGLGFLEDQGIEQVVIVAHSLGSAMASYYLANNKRPVAALIGVGMSTGSGDPRTDTAVSLQSIRIPVLDLYGSNDLETVRNYASKRAEAANRAGNEGYEQIKVQGANHFFDGKEEELIETVSTWLENYD